MENKYIFASFNADIERNTNKNSQVELSCNEILGITVLVLFDCYVITVGNMLSRD